MYFVDNFSNMKNIRWIILFFVFWQSVTPIFAQTQLLMAEEDNCYWCEKWNQDVGKIYPKTPEGRAAPLARFNIHDGYSNAIFTKGINYTPTFILVNDGVELGRIEGYPGEEFFWALVSILFKENNIVLDRIDS
tara:strand:+ start:3093 stop:3494 length:402 start_codon:yes stop_codon:yes gene_type:complete